MGHSRDRSLCISGTTLVVLGCTDSGLGLDSLLGLLGVGHEEAPRTKPGCVTPRFIPSVSSFPGGEFTFVVHSPTVVFPWLLAI